MNRLLQVLLLLSLCSCSPTVTTVMKKKYAPLDYREEITVLGLTEATPTSAVEIGMVRIGDTGFSTKCNFTIAVEKAKIEARKAGGNVIKIIEHIPPSLVGSACDRIKVLILKVENLDELSKINAKKTTEIDSTWDYAKLYVYRPNGAGLFVGYDLYLGDELICTVKNNTKQEIKITRQGINTLWAKTEAKSEVPIEIVFGKEYYLRCSVGMGLVVGRPQLQLVDKVLGKSEYENLLIK